MLHESSRARARQDLSPPPRRSDPNQGASGVACLSFSGWPPASDAQRPPGTGQGDHEGRSPRSVSGPGPPCWQDGSHTLLRPRPHLGSIGSQRPCRMTPRDQPASASFYLRHGSAALAATVLQALLQGPQSLDQVLVLLSEVIPQQTLRTEGSTSPQPEPPRPAVPRTHSLQDKAGLD